MVKDSLMRGTAIDKPVSELVRFHKRMFDTKDFFKDFLFSCVCVFI